MLCHDKCGTYRQQFYSQFPLTQWVIYDHPVFFPCPSSTISLYTDPISRSNKT